MIRTDDKSLCCGCQACKVVCPKDCIVFKGDVIGALYPRIDFNNCINCGRCETVCPIQKKTNVGKIGNAAFIAFAKNKEIRFSGASGGIFQLVANEIIRNDGFVFACKFDENLKLSCVEATTLDEVRKLTKSKYLQSQSADMFPIILQRIKSGRKVLFCSTPCQVSALKNYLGGLAEQENVWFVDFFCHGVPSQELFDKCRYYLETKRKIKINHFEFRTKKKNGATNYYYTEIYEKNGKVFSKIKLYVNNPFFLGFQKYLILRDSCYQCPYGSGDHDADLTIGDCHEVDKYIQGINRFDGVSTVIVNNKKGNEIWWGGYLQNANTGMSILICYIGMDRYMQEELRNLQEGRNSSMTWRICHLKR